MKDDIIVIGADIVGEQFGLESFDHEALVRLTAERLIRGSQLHDCNLVKCLCFWNGNLRKKLKEIDTENEDQGKRLF